MSSGKSNLEFFGGPTLLSLAATYPKLLKVDLEMVQNALDKGAKNIWVVINQKARSAAVQDDGDGTSPEYFEKALRSVGHSLKKSDKLGRFGLGLISPVDKCEAYTFTSTPKGSNAYVEWTFRATEIKDQERVQIPFRSRTDLWFGAISKRGVESVTWRTRAKLEKIHSNRLMNAMTMESLCESIADMFNQSMKKNKTVVSVTFVDEAGNRSTQEIYPSDFSGISVPVLRITNRLGGDTCFRLFIARMGRNGKGGKVLVGEDRNDFRIPFASFLKSLPEEISLSDQAVQALSSGVFEGEILSSRCQVHRNRLGFEATEALIGFGEAIDDWFKKVGSQHFNAAAEGRRQEKYENLAKRTLMALKALAETPLGQSIRDMVKTFKVGTTGKGHVERPANGPVPPGTAINTKPTGEGGHGGGGGEHNQPETEIVNHIPFVAGGPGGKPRKGVRNNSLGLTLVHEPLPSSKLWVLDEHQGILSINTRHPSFVLCEEVGERALSRYEDYLIVQAISVHSIEDQNMQEIALLQVEHSTPMHVWMITQGERLVRAALKKE